MSISWWRSWHGAPTDHKWAVIAHRAGVKVGVVSAVAWALFDYASQCKERGSIAGFDTETYAVYSGFDETEVVAVINAMRDKGIITDDMLTNWAKRQPQREDDSAERVRQWREMKRSVTQGNAKISPDKDKESDIDKKQKEEGDSPGVFKIWTDNMGVPLTPIIADELILAEREYGEAQVKDAIIEAVKYNARNIKYVTTILENRKHGRTKPSTNGKKSKADLHDEQMKQLDRIIAGEEQI